MQRWEISSTCSLIAGTFDRTGWWFILWCWKIRKGLHDFYLPFDCIYMNLQKKNASLLEWGLFCWFFGFPSRFVCLDVVLHLPKMCRSLRSLTRHSLANSECEHIFGCNLPQLAYALHPLGPRSPCLFSLRHGFACPLLQPFPDIRGWQVSLL